MCILIVMHGRNVITIDPRIPTMPGRSTLGLHRPGKTLLRRQAEQAERSAVRGSAGRVKGELHRT